jgi:hypothetical protein
MKQIKAQKETGATTRSVPKTLENSSRKEALDSVFDEFNID